MKAYDALVAQSNKVGWPVVFRSDLFFHDKEILSQIPRKQPFGWILRECGTDYISMYQTPDSWGTTLIKVYTGRAKFFWYNGKAIMEVEPDDLRKLTGQFYYDTKSQLMTEGHDRISAMVEAERLTDLEYKRVYGSMSLPDLPSDWTESA